MFSMKPPLRWNGWKMIPFPSSFTVATEAAKLSIKAQGLSRCHLFA